MQQQEQCKRCVPLLFVSFGKWLHCINLFAVCSCVPCLFTLKRRNLRVFLHHPAEKNQRIIDSIKWSKLESRSLLLASYASLIQATDRFIMSNIREKVGIYEYFIKQEKVGIRKKHASLPFYCDQLAGVLAAWSISTMRVFTSLQKLRGKLRTWLTRTESTQFTRGHSTFT